MCYNRKKSKKERKKALRSDLDGHEMMRGCCCGFVSGLGDRKGVQMRDYVYEK